MNTTGLNMIAETSIAIKFMNTVLPTIAFILTVLGLGVDWPYVALAAGSAVAGSLLFGYFRQEKTFGAQVYKIAVATIGGLIFGSVIVEYKQYAAPAYIAAAYCAASMLILIFLRTVVSLFEKNVGQFTVTMIQRVFNVRLNGDNGQDGEKEPARSSSSGRRRRRITDGVRIEQKDDQVPTVTIAPTAVPDEIKVIEQTVVETKKDGDK